MSAPLRPIVDAVSARLAQMTAGNGYTVVLGGRILRGVEDLASGHDVFPVASIHLSGSAKRDDATSLGIQAAEISVSLFALADVAAPLDTELTMQDELSRALFPEAARIDGRDTLAGTCLWLEYEGCVVLPRQGGGKVCCIRVDLIANYQETLPCS